MMFRSRLALTVFAAVLCAAPAAFAQAGGNAQISYDALMHAKEGAWADYVTSIKGQPQTFTMRYALVEKSAKAIAIEVGGKTPMGPILMRMDFQPIGAGTWKLTRTRMQMGAQPPSEIPVPPDAAPLKKGSSLGPVIGTASIKTAAGTFNCRQYHKSVEQGPNHITFDMWMSDSVGPVGLVKQADTDGRVSVVLSAVGTGAKPQMK